MKRKGGGWQDQPEIPGMRRVLADMLAETLILHTHRCAVRLRAEEVLGAFQLTEREFFEVWAAGGFDA